MVIKNKRGWVRIVEASIAVMLMTVAVLVVINEKNFLNKDKYVKVQETELLILKKIQINATLRNEIFGADSLPVYWNEFTSRGLGETNKTINTMIPSYLNCESKICGIDDPCDFDRDVNKEISAQSVAMSATLTKYSPRQIKLFCWEK